MRCGGLLIGLCAALSAGPLSAATVGLDSQCLDPRLPSITAVAPAPPGDQGFETALFLTGRNASANEDPPELARAPAAPMTDFLAKSASVGELSQASSAADFDPGRDSVSSAGGM